MTEQNRIVLVEDDSEQAALFAQVLSLVGYDVVTAATAEEALVQLASGPTALLLADWDLPGMHGDELIVTAKTQYPGIKTILYSNHTHVEEACASSGADGCMRKTEGIVRLRQLVKEVLA